MYLKSDKRAELINKRNGEQIKYLRSKKSSRSNKEKI